MCYKWHFIFYLCGHTCVRAHVEATGELWMSSLGMPAFYARSVTAWSLVIKLWWLAKEPKGCFYLCLPRTEIPNVYCHASIMSFIVTVIALSFI